MWINPRYLTCDPREESRTVAVIQTIRCDRCQTEISKDRSILKITNGPRRHEPDIDLCQPCMSQLMTYIGREKVATDAPIGTPATV